MLPIRKQFLLALCVLLIGLFWNCQNGGSELPNEVHGTLIDANIKPVINAKVGLFSVNYVPGDTSNKAIKLSTKTDAAGNYAFKEVPPGQYNIVGLQDSLGFFKDSISISGATTIGRDTLKILGALSGIVQLQPQDDPRTAIVQVMGTDNYINVALDGRFTLAGLAEGTYRLRVWVALPNYVPLFAEVRVRSGIHDTLAYPLIPFYSGIPVVTGIRTSLDTVRGIAKITWHPVKYSAFMSYLIYRDPANAVTLSESPINTLRIVDTVYYDTLYKSLDDTIPHDWEYRIRLQGTNNKIGEAYKPGTLHVVPPRTAITWLQIHWLGAHLDSASIKDTVRIGVDYSNPSYMNQSVTWVLGTADTLRKISVNGKIGKDTLVWVAPSVAMAESLKVLVKDAAGRVWSNGIHLQVLLDAPVADAGRDTTVTVGASFTLHGKGRDGFGRIVKWEWDIGGLGKFISVAGGDTLIQAPDKPDANFELVLKVTDDDGQTGLDTLRIQVMPSTVKTSLQMHLLGGHSDSTSIKDTVRIVVDYSNPTYAIQSLVWVLGTSDTLRKMSPNGKIGKDTLVWVAPSTAVVETFTVRVKDAGSGMESNRFILNVVLDEPVADAGRDTVVSYGSSFTLKGNGSDGFGRIVKWEWDIGAKGIFTQTGSGDTLYILPVVADSNYRCILRVTDDDGNSSSDTLVMNIVPSKIIGSLIGSPNQLQYGLQLFSWKGKLIYTIRDNLNDKAIVKEFNVENGRDSILSQYSIKGPWVSAITGDTIYFISDNELVEYLLSTGAWKVLPAIPKMGTVSTACVSEGKLFMFGISNVGHALMEFNLLTWELTRLTVIRTTIGPTNLIQNSGKIYFTVDASSGNLHTENYQYDILTKETVTMTRMQIPRIAFALIWAEGKLFAFGGFKEGDYTRLREVEAFDFQQNIWKTKPPTLIMKENPGVSVLGGKVYLVGGYTPDDNEVKMVEEYQP